MTFGLSCTLLCMLKSAIKMGCCREWGTLLIPALGRPWQGDLCEFETSLAEEGRGWYTQEPFLKEGQGRVMYTWVGTGRAGRSLFKPQASSKAPCLSLNCVQPDQGYLEDHAL